MSGEADARAEQARQQEEARQQMLAQLLTADAKERLNRIRLVKPDKVRQIEDLLIATARQHRLSAIDDAQLVQILAQVSESERKGGKVQIARRGKRDEDRWDDDDDGW
jgi:programmed cell death protein 5